MSRKSYKVIDYVASAYLEGGKLEVEVGNTFDVSITNFIR